jgi:hypothetical protein
VPLFGAFIWSFCCWIAISLVFGASYIWCLIGFGAHIWCLYLVPLFGAYFWSPFLEPIFGARVVPFAVRHQIKAQTGAFI